ncbi:hypothetical protein [Dyadobacter arcticus]|uniref:XRE family transcriptional regulator n=1 Tax=Dyadobacter arcticus TaxID=1078754 RepID=A0ABX0USV5_9BACT|nr:hypothetical protein [Dyadobacter arcticus]NIJ55498.1 hypothetical protein [Dyadobacter arcticus]
MNHDASSPVHDIELIVEGQDGSLFGRVLYDDNLIVEQASDMEKLESNMKNLLHDFHGLDANQINFKIEYDLTAFFEEFRFLNITEIAKASGLNGSLVRQYATGKKFPSAKQAEKLESAVRHLGQRLSNVHIYTSK